MVSRLKNTFLINVLKRLECFVYNSSNAVDFELHDSEETNLVIKILALAGILLEDPQLYQVSSQEEIKKVQQEKA